MPLGNRFSFKCSKHALSLGNRLEKSCKVNRSGLGICCLTFIVASSQHNTTKKAYLMSRDTYQRDYRNVAQSAGAKKPHSDKTSCAVGAAPCMKMGFCIV